MEGPRQFNTRRMTPDDVLRVIVESHRQKWRYRLDAFPDEIPSFEMQARDLWTLCSITAEELEDLFGVHFENRHWEQAGPTVREVCELIASQALAIRLEPATILGRPCLSATVFFALRKILKDAGADVSRLAPSSLLEPYMKKRPEIFLDKITTLGPGKLPVIKIEEHHKQSRKNFGLVLFLLGFVGLLCLSGLPLVYGIWLFAAWLVFVFVGIGCSVPHLPRKPDRVTFGDLETFADLSRAIAQAQEHD